MRFTDALLIDGKIANKGGLPWRHDTATIDPATLGMMRALLRDLRSGLTKVTVGIDPPFDVALGLSLITDDRTDTARRAMAPGRYFTVFEPGSDLPFQCNAVIPLRTGDDETREKAEEVDRYAIGTIAGLSLMVGINQPAPEDHAVVLESLWQQRPLLVTALIPIAAFSAGPELIKLASEFAKYFAAAVLLGV